MIGLTIGLFVVGVASVIAELFLPTLGIVGILGGASIVAAVVVAFRKLGAVAGAATLLAALVAAPTSILLFFRFFPRTFAGRRLILSARQDGREGSAARSGDRYASLAGREGRVVTVLRPSGTVEIEGRRYDAVSSGEYIESGTSVRVTRVEGSHVVVRAAPPASQPESRRST